MLVEMPKSSTLIECEPSALSARNRFAGLMSRCTMPIAWASANAMPACKTRSIASSTSRWPRTERYFSRSTRGGTP